jgi:hypothetical protein
VDRAATTRESDTVRFTKKEVGLTKTIVLSSITGLSELCATGCISEQEQNGSTNNRMLPLSSVPPRSAQHHCRNITITLRDPRGVGQSSMSAVETEAEALAFVVCQSVCRTPKRNGTRITSSFGTETPISCARAWKPFNKPQP